MHPLLVLNVVGLTPELIGANTPNIARLAERGGMRPLRTVTPAVTSAVTTVATTAHGWHPVAGQLHRLILAADGGNGLADVLLAHREKVNYLVLLHLVWGGAGIHVQSVAA